MYLLFRGFASSLLILWFCLYNPSDAGKRMMQLVNGQRPVVEYINNSLVRINVTSRRYSRRDPLYYFNVHIQTYVVFNKQLTVSIHVKVQISLDELIGYTSKRRYLDLDLDLCRYFIVTTGNKILYKKMETQGYRHFTVTNDCVMPIGFYHFYNITWPTESPITFFFPEGRLNIKFIDKGRGNAIVGYGHLDVTLKTVPVTED